MSQWTHPICETCWLEHNPDRGPVRINIVEPESCCWCGKITQSGIYTRADPQSLPHHETHEY